MNRSKLAALTAGAVLLVATVFVPAATFAAGNSISVSPATTTITPAGSTGSSFTVNVTGNGSVNISGAGAALSFDNSRLQLTALTQDATEVAHGVTYAGFPTAANLVSFIALANAAGQIPTIGWTYTDGASSETAGAEHGIFSATFQVIGTGDTTLAPVVVAGVGGLLDGTVGPTTYGASLTGIVLNNGAVANTAGSPGPSPTPTPVPSTPASAPPATGTSNITGTVYAGFVGLTCPTALTIPLVRNATNVAGFVCSVSSNSTWTLNANDPKVVNHGFMTDGSYVLSNPMHVQQGALYDANLATPGGNQVAGGTNSANVALNLSQFGAPQDHAGNYGIQIIFSAVSGF